MDVTITVSEAIIATSDVRLMSDMSHVCLSEVRVDLSPFTWTNQLEDGEEFLASMKQDLRGRYVHRHKGKSVKRGNPYRRR